jgi:exosortase K
MKRRFSWTWIAQCTVVLVCAFALKLYYSRASANHLRWILAPTTACVELVSGTSFEFESHAGYVSGDRGFLIATSCAGVNFLITAFLMLSGKKLLSDRSKDIAWGSIPASAVIAYLVTLVANTTRIAIALRLQRMPGEVGWLNPNQIHRFEGIFVYFGFLLLLFVASETMSSEKRSGVFRQSRFPLLVYYATMLGIPLANGAYRQGADFWEHSLFVLLIPLVLILSIAAFRFSRQWRVLRSEMVQRNVSPRGCPADAAEEHQEGCVRIAWQFIAGKVEREASSPGGKAEGESDLATSHSSAVPPGLFGTVINLVTHR